MTDRADVHLLSLVIKVFGGRYCENINYFSSTVVTNNNCYY